MSILEKEQRQVENSINNVLSAIERGIITNSTSKRLKELETRQKEIERLILIERSKTAIKLSEKDIRAFYETALELEPLMLINYVIKQIKVYNDCIEIELNTPTQKSPDDDNNQGFFFYDKKQPKPNTFLNVRFRLKLVCQSSLCREMQRLFFILMIHPSVRLCIRDFIFWGVTSFFQDTQRYGRRSMHTHGHSGECRRWCKHRLRSSWVGEIRRYRGR